MSIQLRPWTHPKTGAIRIYVGARYDYSAWQGGVGEADGCWIEASPTNGQCVIRSRSDGPRRPMLVGEAMRNLRMHYDLDCQFDELVERIANAQTKGGNFSDSRYFKNLESTRRRKYDGSLLLGWEDRPAA